MSQKALEEFFRRLSEDPALQKEACETSALFSGTAPDDGEIFPAIAKLARKYGFHFTQEEFRDFSFESLCDQGESDTRPTSL